MLFFEIRNRRPVKECETVEIRQRIHDVIVVPVDFESCNRQSL
jgi:hypothetical protein